MSTLQELLNLGLIAIGSDDSRFAKMEAAGAALVKHLLSNPALVIPATLIAIDCDADENDPILTLVDEQLANEWKTIRNAHVNRPRELLRSIIIQALSVLGPDKPRMAALIWQTAFSPINHNQARLGKEGDLVRKLLQDFQKRAEDAAPARASFSKSPLLKKHQKRGPIQSYTQLKDEDIVTDIGRSAGPHDSSGTPFEDPNPHWPNAAQDWSYEFTPRMTTALVKAVNLGMQQVLIPIDKELQSQRNELEKRLTSHLETIQMRTDTRLDVLWWSEAKYSPSLRRGYREMQRAVAAVTMAHDLSMLVPAMAPTSVTYVLGEAVAAILQYDSKPEQWSVETLLDALRTNNTDLREIIPDTTTTNGRVPLFELVAKAIDGNRVAREGVSGRTGIDPGLEISLPDFSMWMFRDIQARRLVEELR